MCLHLYRNRTEPEVCERILLEKEAERDSHREQFGSAEEPFALDLVARSANDVNGMRQFEKTFMRIRKCFGREGIHIQTGLGDVSHGRVIVHMGGEDRPHGLYNR